jgi:hypothetical protein
MLYEIYAWVDRCDNFALVGAEAAPTYPWLRSAECIASFEAENWEDARALYNELVIDPPIVVRPLQVRKIA